MAKRARKSPEATLAEARSRVAEMETQVQEEAVEQSGAEADLAAAQANLEELEREHAAKALAGEIDEHNERMHRCWQMCISYNETVEKLNEQGVEIMRLHEKSLRVRSMDLGAGQAMKSPVRSVAMRPRHIQPLDLGNVPEGDREINQEESLPKVAQKLP